MTRDEARNVAVILVDEIGQLGGIKAAPVSAISSRLREQGLLDAILAGLQQQFAREIKPTVGEIAELQQSLQRSLYLTAPQPTAVTDPAMTLESLYKAYVSVRAGGSSLLTKGRVLDTVVNALRKAGLTVRRGEYVNDFLFDLVIRLPDTPPRVAEVLSFGTAAKDWTPIEHDAGHFLYACEHVKAEGLAFIKPPLDVSHDNAYSSYSRVLGWFKEAGVPVRLPEDAKRGRELFGDDSTLSHRR